MRVSIRAATRRTVSGARGVANGNLCVGGRESERARDPTLFAFVRLSNHSDITVGWGNEERCEAIRTYLGTVEVDGRSE